MGLGTSDDGFYLGFTELSVIGHSILELFFEIEDYVVVFEVEFALVKQKTGLLDVL